MLKTKGEKEYTIYQVFISCFCINLRIIDIKLKKFHLLGKKLPIFWWFKDSNIALVNLSFFKLASPLS